MTVHCNARAWCPYRDCPHYDAHEPRDTGDGTPCTTARPCNRPLLHLGVKGRKRTTKCVEVSENVQ